MRQILKLQNCEMVRRARSMMDSLESAMSIVSKKLPSYHLSSWTSVVTPDPPIPNSGERTDLGAHKVFGQVVGARA